MRSIRGVVAALVCLALIAPCFGAGPTLVITDAGYQLMTVGADGKAVLTDVGQVVDLRGNAPGPTPGPDPTPAPPDVSDPIAAKVKGWTESIDDPVSAQSLARLYRSVGSAAAGNSREDIMAALKDGSDSILVATGGTNNWKEWRQKVSSLIDAEEAKGPIDWKKFCESVADGLEQASPGAAIPPVILALIMRLIELVISRFLGGGLGGTGV